MKTFISKYAFFSLLLGFGSCFLPSNGFADEPAKASALPEAPCSPDTILTFFPQLYVNEVLKRNNIPEERWKGITEALSGKDQEILDAIEKKAEAMNPNPLKDPSQRVAAVKLFKDTLLEVFSRIMRANGVTDDKQNEKMLDEIQVLKAQKFTECLRKGEMNLPEIDDEDDEDDDEEDEEEEAPPMLK